MNSVFSNFSKQCIQGSPYTFYKVPYSWIKHKDNVYHVTFVTFPHCHNKPLHYSADDLNHLSSDASFCYLDNCQQEQAFPFSQRHAVAPSCSLLTILHTWSQQEGVRMPIIFTICCAGYSGEAECCWLHWQKLTAPWTWDPCKSTQQTVFLRAAGCTCSHEPGDGALHCLCFSAWKQTKAIFLCVFKCSLW